MSCDHWREQISALIDGELSVADADAVHRHTETCASCAAHMAQIEQLTHPVGDRPQLHNASRSQPSRVTEPHTIKAVPPTRGADLLRFGLFVIGGTLLALNLVDVCSRPDGALTHLIRHDGVFGAALGFAMTAVAVRPERAIGLIPITGAIAALMVIVAVVDVAAGTASILGESTHALELAGLICVWGVSGGPTRWRRRLFTSRTVGTPTVPT